MWSARESSSGSTLTNDGSYPPLPIWVCPVSLPGVAPAPGLPPPGPFSQPNARGSPAIPAPPSVQDRQADHPPHLPPRQRSSDTPRGHASQEGQRRNSHRARAARLPDTGRCPSPLRPGTGYAGFVARPHAGSRVPAGRERSAPSNGRGSQPLLFGPKAGASIAGRTTSGSLPAHAPLRQACPWPRQRTGLRYWIFDLRSHSNRQSPILLGA